MKKYLLTSAGGASFLCLLASSICVQAAPVNTITPNKQESERKLSDNNFAIEISNNLESNPDNVKNVNETDIRINNGKYTDWRIFLKMLQIFYLVFQELH
ncbi:MAG: hypothetical protein KME29_37500 [Calothrix sp. FI2-JRJ7]|nr:hypothetical protein [Calothrix sp. FI2-JRJ7]